jgi:glycosyltransferase involved in cell wall biosynthesis
MKILHLCDSLNPAGLGGYESIIHYLSSTMADLGHESFVITQSPYRHSPESIEHPHYTIYYLRGNLLEARKWEYYALSEEERVEAAGELFKPSDIGENVDILAGQLAGLIGVIQPDIIHAHSTYIVFNRVIKRLRQSIQLEIPVVVTIHGLPKSIILPDGRESTDYDEFVSDSDFDLVLAVSENVAEALRKYLKSEVHDRIRVVYSGIDLSTFRPLPDVEKQWDVAFMGRLETMKSVDLFPEMLSILRPRFPSLKMMMTGEGSLKSWLFNEFEKRDVSSMIDYKGVVETDDVPLLLNKSRIFLYPSRQEPFGLSIIEAMACGVPVITTNVFGPGEIISPDYDGIAVSPDDVNALADAVDSLLSDRELREKIAGNALRSAQKYDIREYAKQLLTIYHDLIEKQKK